MTSLRFRCVGAIFVVATAPAFAQDMGGMQMPMPPAPTKPAPASHAEPPKAAGAEHPHGTRAKHAHETHPADTGQAASTATPSNAAMPADMPMAPEAMPGMQPAPVAPRTPIPVVTDADRAAAIPPPHDHPVHDNPIENYTVFNRLEGWNADPGTGMHWEGATWIGTDLNRLWLRTEGEERASRLESADLEVLYGHSMSPWWDVLAGVRHDFKPGASQDFVALGVQGLAPYKFEVAATAYVGQSGQTSARLEADYDLLLTNRLILQPLVEVNLYGQSDARRGIGAGLSTMEAGLRLRYEVTRRFAPYVGVVHDQAYGATADFRRAEGEDPGETRVVAGIRIWF